MSTRVSTPLWRNAVTLAGAALAVISVLFILSFLFFDLLSGRQNPYLGLFTYLIFPGVLVVGVVMMVSGVGLARRRHRRRHRLTPLVDYFPRIDLNLPHHRRALITAGTVVALTIPLIGVLSYEG